MVSERARLDCGAPAAREVRLPWADRRERKSLRGFRPELNANGEAQRHITLVIFVAVTLVDRVEL
jgi:hypothetical protein